MKKHAVFVDCLTHYILMDSSYLVDTINME